MLADTNSRPDVQESYSTATSTSNLRVNLDRRTPADMIIAAGLSKAALGNRLIRLHSEWDSSSKPIPMKRSEIEALAASFPVEPAQIRNEPNPHAGLVKVERAGEMSYRLPLELAEESAAAWHLHELKLLLQNLKTLPRVRQDLEAWLGPVQDAPKIVAAVVAWWLSPKCAACRGVGERLAKGTNRSTGQPCSVCKGSGERKMPYRGGGMRLLAYMRECMKDARESISKRFKHEKTSRSDRAPRPDLLVREGERWRARDGRLWDMDLADDAEAMQRVARVLDPSVTAEDVARRRLLLARLATDPTQTALYYSSGHAWKTFRHGPTGNDLIEKVGDAPT